jgi:Fur family transcriptional regulator, ferric uptake regulator
MKLLDQLKAHGVRVTPQRAIILDAVEHMSEHFTAEDVYAAVQMVSSYINIATVYRTLELLKELEMVTDSDMGAGATHYALRTHGPHHHAICRVCGRSFEFPHTLLETPIARLNAEYGFVADAHHVVVFGWCAGCLQQPAAQEQQSATQE